MASVGDAHDHGFDHQDFDPHWRTHESQMGKRRSVAGRGRVMMSDVNVWTGTGRIGTQPELKSIGGTSKLEFRFANTQKWNGGERTSWLTVGIWGKRADALAKHLSKGQQVMVSGELEVREYEHNGQKRVSVEIRANQLEFGKGGEPRRGDDFGKTQDFPADDFGDDDIPFAPLHLLYGSEAL